MRENKLDVFIMNVILFIYPFELFESIHNQSILGAFSPFRVVILPLCLIYIVICGKDKTDTNKIDIPVICVFFTMSVVSILNNGSLTSLFSFIGNIVQFAMAYMWVKRCKFAKSTLYIITTWCLFQVPNLLHSIFTGNFGMTLRFQGFFFDPNYLCAFVIGSICAAFYLLKTTSKKITKLYCWFIMLFGPIMVFLSFSRGGMLGLLLIITIYLLADHKKIFVGIVVTMIPIISTMIVRSKFLTWSDAADNVIDAFIYRTFTLSEDVNELTAGRSDLIKVFFDNIGDFVFIGSDLEHYMTTYNGGQYPHNGFIEIIVQSGLIAGLLYLCLLGIRVVKEIVMTHKYKKTPIEFMVAIGVLVPLTFLSYTSKIVWLCMGFLFALSSRQVYKAHI